MTTAQDSSVVAPHALADRAVPDIPVLDGIRAIAVSMVMIAHCGFDRIVPGGLGVTLFFFLSGFLITTLMRVENETRGSVDLQNFYLRRCFRIMPPLYITLLLSLLLVVSGLYPHGGVFGLQGPLTWTGVLSQIFFVQNYAFYWGEPVALPITGVWSLAVEEHYYLAFPALYVFLLRRLPARLQAAACLTLCAVVLGLRLYNAATMTDFSANYVFTHTRIDSILFGACLALYNNPVLDPKAWRPRGWQALLAIAALLALLLVRDHVFRETYRYTLQGILLYVIFSYAITATGLVGAVLSSRPARRVARYSYTLYLVHLLLIGQMLRWLPWWPAVAVAVVLSWLYAAAMNKTIERPLAALRRRLHWRRDSTDLVTAR